MHTSRRAFLGAVAGTSTALAGCTGLFGGGGARVSPSGDPLESPAANAPLPDDASDRTYAAMGTGGPEVVYFGSWKCPFCAEFAVGSDRVLSLSTIVTDYVEPGNLQLTYRCLAYTTNGDPFLGQDAPRAARAGLSVWNRAPEAYWGYHEYVMANQPPESETWATTDRLVGFAESANVSDTAGVRDDLENGQFEEPVRANTSAFADAGGSGTPTLLVDGETYSPFEPDKTRQALDALAE
ncbi:DsbA family protein [Halorarius litoreus]|uniref:DsbA family protein n=1 Tax=Halorarius litoreus TaxID=2962676 RepID=UPI0020CDCA6C|nr:thioredoxin domain-containing protein [Halorarius litoreus]